MCARYTIRTPAELLAARFGLDQVPDLRPRYNVAPSQPVPVVGVKAGGRGRRLIVATSGPLVGPPAGRLWLRRAASVAA